MHLPAKLQGQENLLWMMRWVGGLYQIVLSHCPFTAELTQPNNHRVSRGNLTNHRNNVGANYGATSQALPHSRPQHSDKIRQLMYVAWSAGSMWLLSSWSAGVVLAEIVGGCPGCDNVLSLLVNNPIIVHVMHPWMPMLNVFIIFHMTVHMKFTNYQFILSIQLHYHI